MIDRLFRIALCGLVIPVVIVAGLLSVPTTCECGAPLPHDHSIFALGDHSHGPSTDSDNADEYEGPGLRSPSPRISIGSADGVPISQLVDEAHRGSIEQFPTEQSVLAGVASGPASPPPRA